MKLDLAISPCPNDTFIFHQLLTPGNLPFELELHLEDVEELNRRAVEESRHAITKLSFFAMAALRDRYTLLNAGGALGRGCGPLLITGAKHASRSITEILEQMEDKRILIPGRWTTANLLTHLFLSARGVPVDRIEFVPVRYDRIMRELNSDQAALGVIIHEERFTFQDQGLSSLQDLGLWWETTTGLPIPLGGIALRNELVAAYRDTLEQAIRTSILAARRDIAPAWNFIKANAQSLHDRVIKSHIELYVNDFSLDYGVEGQRAIDHLFRMADGAGIV